MKYKTEQEQFWAGNFGNAYIDRNASDEFVRRRISFFSRVLGFMERIDSAVEFGANVGNNLRALKVLLPEAALSAIEINQKAVKQLRALKLARVYHKSILDYAGIDSHDLALICGVLIHIDPASLSTVYEKLYAASRRYILIDEYYNPTPVEVPYRGHRGKLFKRDFAGEMLDRYPDLKLVSYGFVYHRDLQFPADDSTWFLLEKR